MTSKSQSERPDPTDRPAASLITPGLKSILEGKLERALGQVKRINPAFRADRPPFSSGEPVPVPDNLKALFDIADDEPMTCADAFKDKPFNKGETVYLRSGSPALTVVYADCCEVDVAYFAGGKLRREEFPIQALTHDGHDEMPF